MGAHHPRHAAQESRSVRRLAVAVIAPVALVTLVALALLWPSDGISGPEPSSSASEILGTVVAVTEEPCPQDAADDVNGCGTARVEVTEGAQDGEVVEAPLPNGPGAPEVGEGDDVVLIELGDPAAATYSIVDQRRGTQLWVLVAAFALAVVAFGRWRGLAALAGLGVTFALLVLFVVPAILAGEPPLLVAIVGSSAIMLTVLYLTHGFSLSTTVAVLGTLTSLALTGVLSALAVGALHLSGITDDLSFTVGSSYSVNTEGLLLAGILIGALGVLDDVTVTQGAAVAEIAAANPGYGFRPLYRAGARVGRSHIASVINTIVLAYAGSALPLLVLVVANDDPLGSVVTDQVIAQEIVRAVVATLGLIAAVPITTALAALVSTRTTEPEAA